MPTDIFFLKTLGQYYATNSISKAEGDESDKLKKMPDLCIFSFPLQKSLCLSTWSSACIIFYFVSL